MEQFTLVITRIKTHRWFIPAILIIFFALLAALVGSNSSNGQIAHAPESTAALDTFIPNGFVLVPIEVQNLAALDSMVGQFGVIDLYASGEGTPVGQGLKLVRSPQDAAQFAVLVAENDAREIVRLSDKPFQVVVQSPDKAKAEVRKTKATQHIVWED
jgi:hypothetical protein